MTEQSEERVARRGCEQQEQQEREQQERQERQELRDELDRLHPPGAVRWLAKCVACGTWHPLPTLPGSFDYPCPRCTAVFVVRKGGRVSLGLAARSASGGALPEYEEWPPDDELLSGGEICTICAENAEGTADPSDVERLLNHFCLVVERQQPCPPEILLFLRRGFQAYFDKGKKNLEAALGLRRSRRGRPKADEGRRCRIAIVLLQFRLEGLTYEGAVEATSTQKGISNEATIMAEAWAAHKLEALAALRVHRAAREEWWTDAELARLDEIYKDADAETTAWIASARLRASQPSRG
jgi:hypothetical protein